MPTIKLELGGGGKNKARGDGWVNMDKLPCADLQHDLTIYPWPLEDDSCEAVYSSHCLEHLPDPMRVLHEICRVCVVGAPVEIRVPAPGSDLAMVWDHRHVFSPIAAINADVHFAHEHWTGPKRLKLERIAYEPSILLEEFRRDLAGWKNLSDEVVMKYWPRTCHECRFFYVVQRT